MPPSIWKRGRVVECTGLGAKERSDCASAGNLHSRLRAVARPELKPAWEISRQYFGSVAEWLNAPVLKTGRGLRLS